MYNNTICQYDLIVFFLNNHVKLQTSNSFQKQVQQTKKQT